MTDYKRTHTAVAGMSKSPEGSERPSARSRGAQIVVSTFGGNHNGLGLRVMAAAALKGDDVLNTAGDKLGTLDEIILDAPSGRIAYAVISTGGFLGIRDKLFAIPCVRSPGTLRTSVSFSTSRRSDWSKHRDSTRTIGRPWPMRLGLARCTPTTALVLTTGSEAVPVV